MGFITTKDLENAKKLYRSKITDINNEIISRKRVYESDRLEKG
jgi:hypothetical protein